MSPQATPARRAHLPAVVRECPVRLGHLVGVLTPFDGGTQAIARIEDLVGQTLDHRLLPARLREKLTSQRNASVVDRSARTSTGTW